jgi:hypothetical protein
LPFCMMCALWPTVSLFSLSPNNSSTYFKFWNNILCFIPGSLWCGIFLWQNFVPPVPLSHSYRLKCCQCCTHIMHTYDICMCPHNDRFRWINSPVLI